ncbi:MAG: four helix bundle protein [Clostridia bacterium]|nr:four helix bundle protein [Clostridia bacterium]
MANAIEDKSFEFAVRIVRLSQYLNSEKKEYVMSKQILKCGTSIGANVAEAQQAQSYADFIAKIGIASKEAQETYYWIRLLARTGYITPRMSRSLLSDCNELIRLLTSILNTAKNKQSVR